MVTFREIQGKIHVHCGCSCPECGQTDYDKGFNAGLKKILISARSQDLMTTDWYTFFDEKRIFDYRWYLRCDRRELAETCEPDIRRGCLASVERIEAAYPEILEVECDDRFWGELSGKHAAIRWLGEEDRQCAEDEFPFLDT